MNLSMTPIAAERPILTFVALLATSIWVGGFVTIAVVARVARRQLDPGSRVAFFRDLGRAYGLLGTGALAVAIACGAAMLDAHGWDGTAVAAALATAALVVATCAGMLQARTMTRLRERAGREPGDELLAVRVQRGARLAVALRATIGLLTLAILALAGVLAS
jgi:uncharacterized membrane protein